MQKNVTELTQRLLRSLDSNYNVINMFEIVEIISLLEKVAITKELLETTRLGKHINELRRKTTNADLSRRAKELLKKWRSMVIPTENGQIKLSPPLQDKDLKRPKSPVQDVAKLRVRSSTPTKVSPPMLAQKVASPIMHAERLVSPNLQGNRITNFEKTVSPSMKQVSPKLMVQFHNQATSPPLVAGQSADVNLNQLNTKKRPAKNSIDHINAKRARMNGGVTDLDFSDNSNSSFKDVILPLANKPELKSDVILINSDSNSSFSEKTVEPQIDQQQPKKRGRKKGSKNHKNLLDEAEASFTNNLAASASRGNSKVKTTQELLASIQNKNSVLVGAGLKPKEDLEEKAAKLTERVSIIDQKLNANTHRNKYSQKNKFNVSSNSRNEKVLESGSVINDKSLINKLKEEYDEEIVVVDDIAPDSDSNFENKIENRESETTLHENVVKSLSIEEATSLLPPIDKSILLEDDSSQPPCTCFIKENKLDFSVDDEDVEQPPPYEIIEDPECAAKCYLANKYKTFDISNEKVNHLHDNNIPNVNGNYSIGSSKPEPQVRNGLYVNIVPNIYERLERDVRNFNGETFKKYSVSKETDDGVSVINDKIDEKNKWIRENSEEKSDICESRTEDKKVFREWYECLDKPSYNGDILRILPYCIVD
ncbi:mediator of RNA polymerase II transcription subunit 26 [Sitophilus oryzae]|uniref:Mediator of RNA polymerase II transcription subunit 26 n=1 Tax=Sitophilus oryzae TaxID=7048 RepID=A0A6J2YKD6_SITOR|nr:mediator of RNA polymerase II transcription subunit 26 [Sitophilus oryzae]